MSEHDMNISSKSCTEYNKKILRAEQCAEKQSLIYQKICTSTSFFRWETLRRMYTMETKQCSQWTCHREKWLKSLALAAAASRFIYRFFFVLFDAKFFFVFKMISNDEVDWECSKKKTHWKNTRRWFNSCNLQHFHSTSFQLNLIRKWWCVCIQNIYKIILLLDTIYSAQLS